MKKKIIYIVLLMMVISSYPLYNYFSADEDEEVVEKTTEIKVKNGDLRINFDSSDFSQSFIESRKIDSYRIGGRYIFSPKLLFIGNFSYKEVDTSQNRTGNVFGFTITNGSQQQRKGFNSEFQALYEDNKFSVC